MGVDYDPYDDETMVDPESVYRQLRLHDPVHHLPAYDAWALASFDAVWQACSDTTHFSVRRGQTPNQVLLGEPASNLTFPELDPPEHRLRRRVVAPHYTRESAGADVERITAITREVLGPLVGAGSFDAFGDYASVVSARVAAEKAGVPAADAVVVSDLLHQALSRELGQKGTSERNMAAMGEVFLYLLELIGRCRAGQEPAHGVLRDLLEASVAGEPLSDEQVAAEVHTLLVTGSETAEHGSAAAIYYLATHPEQKATLLADPSVAPWAFAEALRYHHPTDMLCRTVSADVTVEGRQLRAGQGVLLIWASANRDEREFERADQFDISRRPSRSLLFGHGQHKCIGEHIAMEMGTALLAELAGAVVDYEVEYAGVHRRRGEFLKGFDAMPIAVTR
jgi:cytochrome P450